MPSKSTAQDPHVQAWFKPKATGADQSLQAGLLPSMVAGILSLEPA